MKFQAIKKFQSPHWEYGNKTYHKLSRAVTLIEKYKLSGGKVEAEKGLRRGGQSDGS